MMRRMIVTYARKIRYYLLVPRTVMDTKNTTVVENYVPIAQSLHKCTESEKSCEGGHASCLGRVSMEMAEDITVISWKQRDL